MVIQQVLLYFIPSLLLFVFSVLALLAAYSKATHHLVWLLPMTAGWGLRLIASAFSLSYSYAMQRTLAASLSTHPFTPFNNHPFNWMIPLMTIISGVSTLCLLWSVFALYMKIKNSGPQTPRV